MDYMEMLTAHTLTDLLEGRKPKEAKEESKAKSGDADGEDKLDYSKKNWDSDSEGEAKLQKIIRKKIQSDDDTDEPFGYRKGKKSLLHHLITWEFPSNENDKRKQPKSDEHIQKMQQGRKKTIKEFMEEYLQNM